MIILKGLSIIRNCFRLNSGSLKYFKGDMEVDNGSWSWKNMSLQARQNPRKILAVNFIYSTFAGYKLEALPKLKAFTVIFE